MHIICKSEYIKYVNSEVWKMTRSYIRLYQMIHIPHNIQIYNNK